MHVGTWNLTLRLNLHRKPLPLPLPPRITSGLTRERRDAVHGIAPVADPAGKWIVGGVAYKMQRFKLEDRVFTSKNYFWPLIQSELTNCPSLIQSPNW